jgi:hypothetical protein
VLGVSLAALVIKTELRVRAIYAITFVLFGVVGAIAVKAARRRQRQLAAAAAAAPAVAISAEERSDELQVSVPAAGRPLHAEKV